MLITIDGYNIATQWTLAPVMDGLYQNLMKQPDIKDRITNDWSDENGLEVLIEPAKVKSNEITCSFFCDTYAKYKEFCTYLREHPIIELFTEYTGESYFLEFLQCSSFNDYRDYNIFGVKFRQANPIDTSLAYINTEVGLRIIAENGNYIII